MATYVERSKEQREKLIGEVLSIIETGDLKWEKCWSPGALAPFNPVTKTRYRGINRFYLGYVAKKNEYTDPRWMTFHQIKNAGFKLEKGAKGAHVEKWGIKTCQVTDNDDEEGVGSNLGLSPYPVLQGMFVVFNAKHIEGINPLLKNEEQAPELNSMILKVADNFLEKLEANYCESVLSEAFYRLATDTIVVPERSRFKTAEDFLATICHEAAHSTGHMTRLNRDMTCGYHTDSYAYEELIAELAALFTQSSLGTEHFGHVIENSAAYLDSWVRGLNETPKILFTAMTAAELASEYLIERYETNQLIAKKAI